MAIKAFPPGNGVALTVQRIRTRPSARLFKYTLGGSITLCGGFLLMADVTTASAPLLRSLFDAIRSAMT